MTQAIKKHFPTLFTSIIFILLFLFFVKVNPYIPYDTDDWVHSMSTRSALPIAGIWNPGRVLPEVLMPVMGFVSGAFIYPIVGSYTQSMILMNALFVSVAIVVYIKMFIRFIDKNHNITKIAKKYTLGIFFLLMHFVLFKFQDSGNQHMFTTTDQTTLYFYTIPNILNGCIVLWLLTNPNYNIIDKSKIPQSAFLMLATYFAVFSNAFCVALVSFSSVSIMMSVLKERKSPLIANIKKLIKTHLYHIIVVLMWITSILFEFTGGRADSLKSPFIASLKSSIKNTIITSTNLNTIAAAIAISIFAVSIFMMIKRKIRPELYIKLLLSSLLSSLIIIGLCSKAGAGYLIRLYVFFPIAMFVIILLTSLLAKIQKTYQYAFIAIPLIVCVLFFEARFVSMRTYRPMNTLPNLSIHETIHMSESLVNEVIDASKSGLKEYTLKVPKIPNDNSNWPFSIHYGNGISNSLYRNGVINIPTEVITTPDSSANIKYNIQYK